jgi:hypothetical protein
MSAPSSAVAANGWDDPAFLLRAWRRREAQLIRLLTVKNLYNVRAQFERRSAAGEPDGVDVPEYLRIMMALLGSWAINKDELLIQLLDLFANIDVNRDMVCARERAPRARRASSARARSSPAIAIRPGARPARDRDPSPHTPAHARSHTLTHAHAPPRSTSTGTS